MQSDFPAPVAMRTMTFLMCITGNSASNCQGRNCSVLEILSEEHLQASFTLNTVYYQAHKYSHTLSGSDIAVYTSTCMSIQCPRSNLNSRSCNSSIKFLRTKVFIIQACKNVVPRSWGLGWHSQHLVRVWIHQTNGNDGLTSVVAHLLSTESFLAAMWRSRPFVGAFHDC